MEEDPDGRLWTEIEQYREGNRSSRGPVSRRSVLKSATALGFGTVISKRVGGSQTERQNVGLVADTDLGTATAAAEQVIHEFDFGSIGQAVTGQFTAGAIDDLQNRDSVKYVERDEQYTDAGWYRHQTTAQSNEDAIDELQASHSMQNIGMGSENQDGVEESEFRMSILQQLPWGIDRIDADVAHDNRKTGSGSIDVAIVDSGIVSDHEDLQTNLGSGYAVIDCTRQSNRDPSCDRGFDPNDNPRDEPWDDDRDHGTHVAGTVGALLNSLGVVGVAPDVTLHAVKVLDECGWGYWSDIAAGLEYVTNQGWEIANMSLGGRSSSFLLRDATTYADRNNVLLTAATGNSSQKPVDYPARYDETIAVTATTQNDSLAGFSNRGSSTEVTAPGVEIPSTLYERPRGPYGSFSGTSMATPHVTGVLSLLRANGYEADEARRQLRQTAEDIGLSEARQGDGLVDASAALGLDDTGRSTFQVTKQNQPDGVATYVLAVDGSISPADGFEDTACPNYNPPYVTGRVGPEGGSDVVEFTGNVVAADLFGSAELLLDGQPTSPGNLGPELPNTLTVTKDGASNGNAQFEVSVSGVLAPGTDIEKTNTRTGCGILQETLGPASGTDTVHYSGRITDFSLDGPATVRRNGVELGPGDLPGWEDDDGGDNPPRRLEITKEGVPDGVATYLLAVDGSISPADGFEDTACQNYDPPYVTGRIGPQGGTDAVEFTGDIVAADLFGPAEMRLDGNPVSPGDLGPGLRNSLIVTKDGAANGTAEFRISVSGVLAPGTDIEESNIKTGCGTLQETIGPASGTDTLHYSGDITDFSLSGPARVLINGQEVDPDTL